MGLQGVDVLAVVVARRQAPPPSFGTFPRPFVPKVTNDEPPSSAHGCPRSTRAARPPADPFGAKPEAKLEDVADCRGKRGRPVFRSRYRRRRRQPDKGDDTGRRVEELGSRHGEDVCGQDRSGQGHSENGADDNRGGSDDMASDDRGTTRYDRRPTTTLPPEPVRIHSANETPADGTKSLAVPGPQAISSSVSGHVSSVSGHVRGSGECVEQTLHVVASRRKVSGLGAQHSVGTGEQGLGSGDVTWRGGRQLAHQAAGGRTHRPEP